MPSRIRVTKVTIEYASEGRTFTLVFNDPSKVDSIVIGRNDRDRLKTKQAELAGSNPPKAPKVVNHFFNPLKPPSGENVDGVPLSLTSEEGVAASGNVSAAPDQARSLWWHSASCEWFHPEGDE